MITHQADPSYPGLGHGTLAHLRGFLPEEEVELVIVLFGTVWNEVCMDECGICEAERGDGVNLSRFLCLSTSRPDFRRVNLGKYRSVNLPKWKKKPVGFGSTSCRRTQTQNSTDNLSLQN